MELWDQFTTVMTADPLHMVFTILDLLIVAFIIWRLFQLLRGTKGIAFLNVLAVLLVLQVIGGILPLPLFNRLIQVFGVMLLVGFPVLFQGELRRALERLGRRNPLSRFLLGSPPEEARFLNAIVQAASAMAEKRIGGLIVIEREQNLGEVASTGVMIDAELSKELIEQLFVRGPLHDGAIVVKGRRILAASCLLPLSERPDLDPEIGTRHRAGLGMAEASDAVVVIVSEEQGTITLAADGAWEMAIPPERLAMRLAALVLESGEGPRPAGRKRRWAEGRSAAERRRSISGR